MKRKKMKKILFLSLGISLVVCSILIIVFFSYTKSFKFPSFAPITTPGSTTLITAHAGAYGTTPNTLESIESLLLSDADIVEIDIRSHQGTLYLAHDAPKGKERIEDFPTLRSAFTLIKNAQKRVNCDLKEESILRPVIELAREMEMEDLIIVTGSVTRSQLDTFKEENNLFSIYLNMSFFGDPHFFTKKKCKEIAKTTIEYKAFFSDVGVNLDYKKVNKNFYNIMKENDINISVFTVSKKSVLSTLLKYDLFNITTLV